MKLKSILLLPTKRVKRLMGVSQNLRLNPERDQICVIKIPRAASRSFEEKDELAFLRVSETDNSPDEIKGETLFLFKSRI